MSRAISLNERHFMKRLRKIICSAVAIAMLSICQAAQTVRIGIVNFTGVPVDGDKITINGVDRTFKTSVTAPSTQVAIGVSALATAGNYWNQLGSYPYTDISAHQSGATVFLIGKQDAALTTSFVGSWGTVTVTNVTLTNYTALLPFSAYPTAMRATMGNLLVDAISTYPSQKIPSTATALGNFLSLDQPTIVFGANTYSNLNQIFWGGTLTNLAGTNLTGLDVNKLWVKQYAYFTGGLEVTNFAPSVRFYDTAGAADKKRTWLSVDSTGWNVWFYNDALSAASNVFSIDRNSTYGALDANFRTRLKADYIYDTPLSNTFTTNIALMHAFATLVQNPMFYGQAFISNSAPNLTFLETDAGSNLKQFQYRSEAGVLTLYMASDAGAVASNQKVWSIERPGLSQFTADSRFHIFSPVQFDGSVLFASSDIDLNGTLSVNQGLLSGPTATSSTMPGGQDNGLYALDGNGPISDPLTGWSIWSDNGEFKYQTSGANEGAGQENHVHNRTASVFGSGTDYPLTTSTAFIDFGTTDPKITLPTTGTYLIFADVAFTTGTTANDDYRFKLRNETTSTDLSGSDYLTTQFGTTAVATMAHLQATVTTTTINNVIAIWGFNNTAARGTVNSARTRISYVRLY
jgi:hypothetical protein